MKKILVDRRWYCNIGSCGLEKIAARIEEMCRPSLVMDGIGAVEIFPGMPREREHSREDWEVTYTSFLDKVLAISALCNNYFDTLDFRRIDGEDGVVFFYGTCQQGRMGNCKVTGILERPAPA